jgi:hypothetical protein
MIAANDVLGNNLKDKIHCRAGGENFRVLKWWRKELASDSKGRIAGMNFLG